MPAQLLELLYSLFIALSLFVISLFHKYKYIHTHTHTYIYIFFFSLAKMIDTVKDVLFPQTCLDGSMHSCNLSGVVAVERVVWKNNITLIGKEGVCCYIQITI